MRGEYFSTNGSKLAVWPLSTAAINSASVGCIAAEYGKPPRKTPSFKPQAPLKNIQAPTSRETSNFKPQTSEELQTPTSRESAVNKLKSNSGGWLLFYRTWERLRSVNLAVSGRRAHQENQEGGGLRKLRACRNGDV